MKSVSMTFSDAVIDINSSMLEAPGAKSCRKHVRLL